MSSSADVRRPPEVPAASGNAAYSSLKLADSSRDTETVFGDGGAETRIVCGVFFFADEDHPAVAGFPSCIHVPADAHRVPWLAGLTHALVAETIERGPGSDVVMARLSDPLVTRALRYHLETSNEPGWLHGLRDPAISRDCPGCTESWGARGRSPLWRTRPVCHAPPSPRGSPRWSVRARWSTSSAAECAAPRRCSAAIASRWPQLPPRSGMGRSRRCRRHSSATQVRRLGPTAVRRRSLPEVIAAASPLGCSRFPGAPLLVLTAAERTSAGAAERMIGFQAAASALGARGHPTADRSRHGSVGRRFSRWRSHRCT